VAKYKPSVKILAVSINGTVVNNMNTLRGVIGLKVASFQKTDSVIEAMILKAKEMKLVKSG